MKFRIYYEDYDVAWANGILGIRCLEVTACRVAWITLIQEVLDLADEIDILGYVDTVIEQIDCNRNDNPNKQCQCKNGEDWPIDSS